MSIQEPAWLKRTRPCPFFSQGRCLFADSCNFLHDVKVRSAVHQPLLSAALVKLPSLPPKPVFDPPSLVVDAASPRSDSLPSPRSPAGSAHDSSRYSGLLSVLSDVIGPPSDPPTNPEGPLPASGAISASPPSSQNTVHGRTDISSESCPFIACCESTGTTETSSCVEASSILEPGSEAASVDPSGHQTPGSVFPEASVAEFLPVLDEESVDADPTSYLVEAETHAIGSEADDDEDTNDYDEDPTVVLLNRQSTLSSFTGASLLASPRHGVFGESFVASPAENGGADLLSPVPLSAKLRPFPVPSLGNKIKRGDSIDSGYAEGDWVSPLPFPRSPPRSFRSPSVMFPSHSRRASLSSPALRRASHCVNALRSCSHNSIEVIEEVKFDGDDDETALTILDAYDNSPSEKRGEGACYSLQVIVAEEKAEEIGDPSQLPAVTHSPQRYYPEHLHPTREYDLDSCNQHSFISDDNLSFKTALSTQPSYEDLSDISRVSPVKQDSLLSSISGCSTPDTSVLSHYGDAHEFLEQSIVGAHVCEPHLVSQTDGEEARQANISEKFPPVGGVAIDSNVLVASVTDDLQGGDPEKVDSPRGSPSGTLHSRPTLTSSLSVDAFHDPSLANVVLGATPEKAVAPLEHLCGVFHFDKQPLKSSPSGESPSLYDTFGPVTPGTDGDGESVLGYVVPQERLPDVLHCDQPSPKSSPPTGSYNVPSDKGILGCIPVDAGDVQEFALQRRSSGARPSSYTWSPLGLTSNMDEMLDGLPANVVPREHSCGDFHSDKHRPKLCLLAESPHSPSSVKNVLYTAEDQILVVEDSLESGEIAEYLDSQCDNFAQRLSFPLPPPFLPAELVGQSTLSGEAMHAASQDGETGQRHSGFDLTEKVKPRRLPSVGSPDFDADFTSRRGRAVSDLTVRGKSPVTTPGITDIKRLPPPPLEQPGRFDSVPSLYDQYFDDHIFDGVSESSSPVHKDTSPPDVSYLIKEPSQEDHPLDLTSHFSEGKTPLSSDSEPSHFGSDSPQSESVLRPLLTGRRLYLRSSLAELIPKADPANGKDSLFIRRSTRLQREVGSTVVPLGFRRHKPLPAVTRPSQPLHTTLSAAELREVLRIRTDIVREDSPPGCFSASHVPSTTWSPLPVKAMSAPPTGGLRQLRLSTIINKRSSILSTHSSSIASSILSLDHLFNSSSPQSPSVSSTTSLSYNTSLSSSCEQIPEQTRHTLKRARPNSLILQANDDAHFVSQSSLNRRDSCSVSAPVQQPRSWRLSHYRAGSRNYTSADGTRRLYRRTSTLSLSYAVDEEQEMNDGDSTILRPIQSESADDWTRPASVLATPVHAIATPKPNLLFAIASDDVDQVRQVLESGEAGPNDSVGPQSALAFTLTNDKLTHKQEIVKALLAYGANPAALQNPTFNPALRVEGSDQPSGPPLATTLEGMDPATRYFVSRADAAHTRQTSQLIYRSFFRPLTRVRYDVIGQDWALEQLFRVLSMHSQKLAVAPIVVLLCGPSGHGKSLLARKFGSLLDVPTHTVNMTTLRSAHDIWQSYSMSPYEEPSSCTLAEFLIENEGKRCVVVLDEIEKIEDQKALWSLLMPWELGRCSLEAGKRHVDARNVIWLGTSNVGHELVFEHHENRAEPNERMSREEYLQLTSMLRPRVSHCLGPSLVSRVTTVLPFVPFTLDEKKAITAEAVYALSGNTSGTLSPQDVESLVTKALLSYHPSEGARSLHRAISNILVDMI